MTSIREIHIRIERREENTIDLGPLCAGFALAFSIWWFGFVATRLVFDTALACAAFWAVAVVLAPLVFRSSSDKRRLAPLRRAMERLPPSARKGRVRAWKAPARSAPWIWALIVHPAWFLVDADYWEQVRFEVFTVSAAVAVVVVAARTIALVRRARRDYGDSLNGPSALGLSGLVIAEVVVNTPRRFGGWLGRRFRCLEDDPVMALLLTFLSVPFLVAILLAWFDSTTLLDLLYWLSLVLVVFVAWVNLLSER